MKTHPAFIKTKFLVFFVFCLILAFSSCKKQDVAPGAISATFDGVDVNLSTSAFAQKVYDPVVKEYVIDITGSTGTGNGNGSIVINVTSNSPITTGPYASNGIPGKTPFSTIIYQPAGAAPGAEPYISGDAGIPVTVTITSISNTNISGYFDGAFTYPSDGAIANGKFNVGIKSM
jgi:hypothetical protein